ncbi:MAG: hypothetical protein ACKVXR_01990 [Planctomycetota bacterium]
MKPIPSDPLVQLIAQEQRLLAQDKKARHALDEAIVERESFIGVLVGRMRGGVYAKSTVSGTLTDNLAGAVQTNGGLFAAPKPEPKPKDNWAGRMLTVMQTKPGEWWTARMIVDALEKEGHTFKDSKTNPEIIVRGTLHRAQDAYGMFTHMKVGHRVLWKPSRSAQPNGEHVH